MILFIQQHGGAAQHYTQNNIIARPKWEKVGEYLLKNISIQQSKIALGC